MFPLVVKSLRPMFSLIEGQGHWHKPGGWVKLCPPHPSVTHTHIQDLAFLPTQREPLTHREAGIDHKKLINLPKIIYVIIQIKSS